jgi:hypothetical protein
LYADRAPPLMPSVMLLLVIMRFMSTTVTVVFLLTFGVSVLAINAASPRITALSVLRLREPEVKWNPRSLLKGDFDYDGVDDYALGGRKGSLYMLGVVKGSLSGKSKHWTLEFSQDAANQGALCSGTNAGIRLERLSAEEVEEVQRLPRKSRGINLYDEECDSFHIYYDRKEKQFVWWRL